MTPAIAIGQIWRRNSDGMRVRIIEQMLDKHNLVDLDDWRYEVLPTSFSTRRSTGWIFGFNLHRLYTLEETE